MYRIMWWDAAGNARISEIMTKASAEAFKYSMLASQQAQMVYINSAF